MAATKVKFDLGLTRFVASIFIFAAHCVTSFAVRVGEDDRILTTVQFEQIFLGLPSLVLLCLMTGIASWLTPTPDPTNHEKFVLYVNENTGLWFRLSTVFNVFLFGAIGFVFAAFGDDTPQANPISAMALGMGPFWYLSAMMYWSILRLWFRNNRQMLLLCICLSVAILAFWLLPESGRLIKGIGLKVNRILIGLWFISFGYLQGPSFFGKVMRQSTGRLLGVLLIVVLVAVAHELVLRQLFREERTIIYFLQPEARVLNPAASSVWDVPPIVRFLGMLQNLLLWTLVFGVSLIHFYITARLGAYFSSKIKVLLAESSFTVYILHFPILTAAFALLMGKIFTQSGWIIVAFALLYAAVLSIALMGVTVFIRQSFWARFLMWYKL